MKIFYKSKHGLVLMVVLTLLMQIVGPVVGNYVYAGDEVQQEVFSAEVESIIDGIATVNWEYKYDPDGEIKYENIPVNFTLVGDEEKIGVLEVEEGEIKIPIGEYTITKDGQMNVNFNRDNINELLKVLNDESSNSLTPLKPSTSNEENKGNEGQLDSDETDGLDDEDIGETEEGKDPVDPEEITSEPEEETEEDDSARIIENLLGLFSKNLVYADGNDGDYGDLQSHVFTGEFKVIGVEKISNYITRLQEDEEKHGFNLTLSKVTDLDGNAYDEDNHLGLEDEFYLYLEWNLLDGHNYKERDPETFSLPQGIKIQEDILIELKDEYGEIVANAVVKIDGTVELTFTDFVETHSSVKGHMGIVSTIDEKNAEVEDGDIILKPIGDEGEIRITIDLGEREKTIDKKGTPNKGYNADGINWEVTINKMKIDLKDVKVTDVLPEGTEYKEGSLKVTKLKVDLNGNILGGLEEVEITGETVEDGVLSIPLADIKDAYKIEYITTVTDDEQKTFKNKATLSDDDLDDVSADATATINRGEPLKKSVATGYNPKTGIIEWEIEFNFNQKDLNNVTLNDAWTPQGKMHLIEGSLKFQEVTIDENGNAHNEGEVINLPEGAEFVNGKDQFEVTGITTNKAYRITYKTKVNDRVLEVFTISNTAGFGSESHGSGAGVGTYYGSKSVGKVDYKNKIIDWTIEINHDKYPMKKISILDRLGSGLTLEKGSIAITVDGKEYKGSYTVSDENPFELKFPDDFTTDKKIVIKYKTKFVADKVTGNIAKNKADITWTPGGGSTSIMKEVEAETPLNKATEDNSWKNGSYNPETKEITWTIYTNYRENEIENLIVKDEPQGNQKIVEGSVVVTELEIDKDGNMFGPDGDGNMVSMNITEVRTLNSIDSTIDTAANSLTANIGKTNKAYKIEYKTSLEGLSDIQKEYVNQAEIFDGNISLSKIDAKVGIAKAHTYGAKSGKQDGKQIHWAVTVNPGQQKITNLKLEDTISDDQDYLADTFKVYEASVDIEGNATKKGEPIVSEDIYIVHTEGEPTFTVEWKGTVESAYIVEYSTLFFKGHNGVVTNSYEIKGDHVFKDDNTDNTGEVKIKQLGSGGGSGEAGYLVIDKVDSTYGQEETKLGGAEFDLIDLDTGKVLKSGKTDESGQIDFGRLLFGDYQLKETTVPEGYVTPEETQTITINNKYDSSKDKAEYKYTVKNFKPVFAIELSKTGKGNEVLEGAKFKLFDSGYNVIKTSITNADGKILFEDLKEAGTYYIQETIAPEGYVLDETIHEVSIGEKESEPVKISIENNVRVGKISVLGEKTWKDEDSTDRPDSIRVKLTRKVGEQIDNSFFNTKTIESNNEGKWIYEFKDLNEFDENGLKYEYIIEEVNVSENYNPIVDGYDITNIRIGKTEVSGTKYWKDDKAEDRPESIKINLLRNNVVFKTKKVTDQDNWNYSFIDLDKYDEDGKLYSYTIKEHDVPGYESAVTGNDITNTRSEKRSIEITKGWLDNNSINRPDSVTVELYQNDELFDTVDLKADEDWIYKFIDLESYDKEGKPYAYSVKEKPVEGYETIINGFNIKNLRVGKTEIQGNKEWIGGPSIKPTIELQLYRNGEKLGTPVELKDGERQYTWTKLDEFDVNGVRYKYTIDEVRVPGDYRKSISQDGLTITNRYNPYYPPIDPEYPDPTDPIDPDPKDPPKEDPKDPDKPVDPEDPDPTDPVDPETPDITAQVDPEEPPTTIVLDPPTKGTVTVDENGNWTYTPNPGETGKDIFTMVHPEGKEELIEIDLDDLPLGTSEVTKDTLKKLPKTGAVGNLGFYFAGLSLIFLGIFLRKRIA